MRVLSIFAGFIASGCGAFVVFNSAGCGPEAPGGGGESSGGPGGEVGDSTTAGVPTSGITSSTGGDEQGSVTEAESGGGSSSGTDTGDAPVMPAACALVKVDGDVRLPLDMDGVVGGPRVLVLASGGEGSPARVMTRMNERFGDMHGTYRVRSYVLESWPDGVVETEFSLAVARAGHNISRFARLADGSNRFGYVWTGDPTGDNKFDTFFSIFDADAWDVSNEVKIVAPSNSGFIDLLATPTFTEFLATYATEDYNTELDEVSGFSLGILDAAGAHVAAPTPFTKRAPAPGSEMRAFWAGDRVATVMAHNACGADEPLCSPHSVVLARPAAVDGHGLAVDGYAISHMFAGLDDTLHVSRPLIAAEFGKLWTIWYEGEDSSASDEHRTLRGVVLDEFGAPIPWPADEPASKPIDFLTDKTMGGWPNVLVSEFGISVGYDNDQGAFEIHNFDFEFKPLGPPVLLEVELSQASYPAMAALTEPRGLLVMWNEGKESAFSMRMALLECDAG